MLETLARQSMHTIAFELPKPEGEHPPFDPAVEITDKDWERMAANASRGRKFRNHVRLLTVLAMLSPEKVAEYDIGRKALPKLVETYKQQKNDPRIDDLKLMERLAQLRVIAPETVSSIYPDPQELEADLAKMYKNYTLSISFHPRDERVIKAAIIAGGSNPGITEKVKREMLVDSGSGYSYLQRVGYDTVDKLVLCATTVKILDPQNDYHGVHDEIKLQPQDWRAMRTTLSGYRRSFQPSQHIDEFARLALNMTILAANSVRVTDSGLDIQMRSVSDFKQAAAIDLPIQRRF